MNTTTNANEKKIEDPKILYVIIIVLFLAFVLGFGGTFIYRTVNEEQARIESQANLEKMYNKETFALGMDKRYSTYQDFSHVSLNSLTLKLTVYEEQQPDAEKVTIEDVRNFLTDEYDENGNPRVLNQPQNIADYIVWYWHGGDTDVRKYVLYLSQYQDDHQDKYSDVSVYDMDLELLNNLIDDFKNCPDREDYEHY